MTFVQWCLVAIVFVQVITLGLSIYMGHLKRKDERWQRLASLYAVDIREGPK